ncbi:MAG: glycosyltransferase [Syntrophorhabdales bacterium]
MISLISPPLVSIIIPAHNAAPWIAAAIQSGLAQTYPNVEVVMVDDGSTDQTCDIIRSFDGRLKCHYFSESHGAPHARNTGLEMACGEFVQFLDADDILFPHCIERKMKASSQEEADVVYSGGFFFDYNANAGTYEPQIAVSDEPSHVVAHVIGTTIVTTHLLCRKGALKAVGGYDESLVMGQEHDLLFRLAVHGARFVYVPEPLSFNRTGHNPDSITSVTSRNPGNFEALLLRFEQRLIDTPLWKPHVRVALSGRFHEVAVQYLRIGDEIRARLAFIHACELEPAYVSYLSFPRRLLTPLIGPFRAEQLLIRLRRLFPRSTPERNGP